MAPANPPAAFFISLLLKHIISVQPFHLSPPGLVSATIATTHRHAGRIALDFPLRSSTTGDDGDDSSKGEAAYDITLNLFPEDRRSRRESSFANAERSEMNDRPPPTSSPPAATVISATATAASASINTNTAKRKIGSAEDRASALYHQIITQRKQSSFPEKEQRRQSVSSSFKPEQLSEMNDRNPRWIKTQPRSDREETRLDITSMFPKNRPSLLVNTGTKKDYTTSGSYNESKKRESDGNFIGNPNTVRNNVDDDGASFDITQQHYGTDRASFSLRVNSGTMERRGTQSGQVTPRSYVESYRNIAHNFSSNRASLLGHPPPRKVVHKNGDDGVYLDRHQFSSNVSPASVATSDAAPRIATNAMWRKGDPITSPSFSFPKKNETIFLDTPRAFVKNLDMIASTKRGPTEADKYLDTNSFSWNIDSTKRKLPVGSPPRQQPYLDKPRPFQSNVDMVSSNFSGAKFRRSSDIPPELKNIKDYYDVNTAPMPAVDDMAKMGRGATGGDRVNGRMDTGDPVDFTRTRFSTLERTSSVIRDGNMAASRAWTNDKQFSAGDVEGTDGTTNDELPSEEAGREVEDSEDAPEQSPSFDEVMYWLLTHLPNLQEEDAISYFHHLLEDGFDTVDILKELLEEDLYFMKKGHRRAMMRSIRSISGSRSVVFSSDDEERDGGTIFNDGDGAEKSVHGMSQIRDTIESIVSESDASEESKDELGVMGEYETVAASEGTSAQVEKEEISVEVGIEGI